MLLFLACTTPEPPPAESDSDAPACMAPAGEPARSAWGGDSRVTLSATSFFRLEQICGRDWLVDPEGHPLRSLGVNTLGPQGSTGQVTGRARYAEAVDTLYADDQAWAATEVARLRSWGLNTAGAWSSTTLLAEAGLAVTPILYLSGGDWQSGTVADWWDPAWELAVAAKVEAEVRPFEKSPAVIGWFLDNEMRWGPDWRGPETLLELYLGLGPEAPGKAAAVDHLLAELGEVAGVNTVLGTTFSDRQAMLAQRDWSLLATSSVADAQTSAFLSKAAARYFGITTAAIRAVDADHLILGNRDVSVMTPAEVYEAQAPFVDVVSINNYVFMPGIAELALQLSGGLDPSDGFVAQHTITNRPILISEFGFRAADSGLPNSWPPQYPTYATQAERSQAARDYVATYRAVPWVVGWHWFEWVDQPAEGRFDGEDNNWGLVNEADVPYPELTTALTEMSVEMTEDLLITK
ncbi:MAG TPA: hypothetical protein PLA94_01615 [Myxococcota bacterium]|nr:hypothetical protein [Myxococcota bacterium]